jgi:UDP-N-acetylglucosamine transferase subunit ALG13
LIFLTVGTWRNGFDRLIAAVDELISNGVIREEVIAQTGYSAYRPKNMMVIKFCSPNKFRELISKSKFVISHAGMGTIIETARLCKPLIAVPRLSSLGEVDNNHQFITAKHLETEGKILVAYEVSELPVKLKQAESFVPINNRASEDILQAVECMISSVVEKKRAREESVVRFWPYRILKRDDEGIGADLESIMEHFKLQGQVFDMVIFVPNAGKYLKDLFVGKFGNSFHINFVTVRRASTVRRDNLFKKFIFKSKRLSDFMRHFDVFFRLVKHILGIHQKMLAELAIDFDVKNKRVLVIDDDIATGETLSLVKSSLLEHGASSVTVATISNHFLPDKIFADYSVYRYVLLRTKNSRDYYAA